MRKRKLSNRQMEIRVKINQKVSQGVKREGNRRSRIPQFLNQDFLKRLDLKPEGLERWLSSVGLKGFPLSRMNDIQGDFNYYIHYLRGNLQHMDRYTFEEDAQGRIVRAESDKGYWRTYQYGKHGLEKIDSSKGPVCDFFYEDGRLTATRMFNGTRRKLVHEDRRCFIIEETLSGHKRGWHLEDGICVEHINGNIKRTFDYDDGGLLVYETLYMGKTVRRRKYDHFFNDLGQLEGIYEDGRRILTVLDCDTAEGDPPDS